MSENTRGFQRSQVKVLRDRLLESRRFMQVVAGPRQAGKTTLARQTLEGLALPSQYASADEPTLRDRAWIHQQWDLARVKASTHKSGVVLVLDEAQKIPGWSEVVKRLWDEDTLHRIPLKIVLLGSSPLLLQRGLTESLAGRFEMLRVPHWSYPEMREAFGWTVTQFLFYGGYPGAAALIHDPARWASYILDALIETTVSKDILHMTRVDKPALLRRLFQLGCDYSGQVLSYQKMLGQLQERGNTVTLAHYLDLLAGAGLLMGLSKFSGQRVRQRGSSPKLLVLNTALMTAPSSHHFETAMQDREWWGRLVESAVGGHLVNSAAGERIDVCYWREGNQEVDFVLSAGRAVVAIEVKSGKTPSTFPGLETFMTRFPSARTLTVGTHGIPLEEFFSTPAAAWLKPE